MKMKLLLFCILCNFFMFSQNGEFETYDNGLIYSEKTMDKLEYIVDSLNLKFKICDKKEKYNSQKTALVNYLKLDGIEANELKSDIENKVDYNKIIEKFPNSAKTENLILTKYSRTNKYSKKVTNYYSTIETDKDSNYYLDFKEDKFWNEKKGSWIYKFYEKSKYSEASIRCFYIVNGFKNIQLPKKYSELVQYSECLIDTNTNVFFESAETNKYSFVSDTITNDVQILKNFIDLKLNKPIFPIEVYKKSDNLRAKKASINNQTSQNEEEKAIANELKKLDAEYYQYYNKVSDWKIGKSIRIDSLKIKDENFLLLLNKAVVFMEKYNFIDEEMEDYIGKYISKEKALKIKRSRTVMGSCSMDDSPRRHAQKITILAAETYNWNVFIRSHLNIMNDNFESVASSSFGQMSRMTYIKELEELNVNVIDLLLGISFRIDSFSKNHYFGNVGRIGQAIAESKNKDEFEHKAISIISDEKLDDYNRLMIFYLFKNYNNNLKEENRKNNNRTALKLAMNKLPDYLASKIVIN